MRFYIRLTFLVACHFKLQLPLCFTFYGELNVSATTVIRPVRDASQEGYSRSFHRIVSVSGTFDVIAEIKGCFTVSGPLIYGFLAPSLLSAARVPFYKTFLDLCYCLAGSRGV